MFTITYIDNTTFTSQIGLGDWAYLEDKPIAKLSIIVIQKRINLSGFEAYNLLKENCCGVGGKSSVSKIIVMGKIGLSVQKLIWDFQAKKSTSKVVPWGMEWNNKPTTGWREGVHNRIPVITEG